MRDFIKETKKHYVVAKVKGSSLDYFVRNLYKLHIDIPNIKYVDSKEIQLRILDDDYKKLKKEFIDLKFSKVKDVGIYTFKPFIKKYHVLLLAIIFGLIFLIFLSNIIVKVEVIHSNKEIRELVRNDLEDLGIKRLTLKKSYKKIEVIKNQLLDKYPDRLEWLEIEVEGMNYKVRVEERIITKPIPKKESCHVVATKDAIISKVIAHEGETIKRVNSYVKKGDIIISGNITLNEQTKNTVCAEGVIYGEVWYTASTTVELNYEEQLSTGKTRKNIMYETNKIKKSIFRSQFDEYNVANKKIFSLIGVKFYLQTEKEYEVVPRVYTEEEAINVGMIKAREKIEIKLNDDEKIISEKVLKKRINNSTMELELFFAVQEQIGKNIEFEPVKEEKEKE